MLVYATDLHSRVCDTSNKINLTIKFPAPQFSMAARWKCGIVPPPPPPPPPPPTPPTHELVLLLLMACCCVLSHVIAVTRNECPDCSRSYNGPSGTSFFTKVVSDSNKSSRLAATDEEQKSVHERHPVPLPPSCTPPPLPPLLPTPPLSPHAGDESCGPK